MTKTSIVAFCTLVFACSDNPPPIGTTDASKDTNVSDVSPSNDGGPSDDAAGDSSSGDASGSCTLASPPSGSTCASCVQSSCCSTWNACVANSDCTGYVACVRLCYPDAGADAGPPDPDAGVANDGGEGSGFACASACQKKYPAGINDGIVVVDCEDTQCAGKCP